ncbi:MAG: rhodanese-like domain-containing protein [Halobacteriota archaeon]
MTDPQSTRRRFVGFGAAALAVGIAGCAGKNQQGPEDDATETETETTTKTDTQTPTSNESDDSTDTPAQDIAGPRDGDDLPEDTSPRDGYPPEFENQPEERAIDVDSFETKTYGDYDVPLVPTDVAYYWYARGEARFADARSATEYDVSHIFGSALSPAPRGQERNDPTEQWPKSDIIIMYCDCPHHLSTMRAADLLNRGWENVYALDEGFSAWRDRNYPLAGTDTDRVPETWTITGRVPERDAGETVWAVHESSEQQEATEVDDDGKYTLHVRFVDVTGDTEVTIETSSYTVTDTLENLSSGRITISGYVRS